MSFFTKRALSAAACCLIAASSVAPAFAQTAALGGIDGVVRDNTGAVVPGVSVTVINSGTGATRTVTTDSEGHYTAGFLQPGTYEVVLGGGSFGKVDRKNIAVTVGASVTVDGALPAASVTTEVTVSSDAPLIDADKVEGSQVVGQQIVSNLPVASRRFESFVLLTPNVIPDGTTGLIGYRGISGVYNQNLVDGANNNQQFFSEARGRSIGSPYVFPVDSIREFESSATGYSAELGGAAGGIINAVTKAGSNSFHGDVFEYYRTPGWNALDAQNKYSGRLTNNPFNLTQPIKVQHQFGVSVGGAILHDKLFYHFSYDGYRKINPITYLSTYNTSTTNVANLVHLCDGGTTNLTDNGITYPTSIPNVSATQCAAVVTAIQGQLGAFQRNAKQDIYFPRLDYQLTSKTHLMAEFLFANFHQPNGYNGATTVNNGGVSQNGTADFHERILIASAETQLSSRSVNVVHFQWARDLETDGTNTGGPANSIGSSTAGVVSFGETSALPRGKFPDEHRWQATDVYSMTLGHHTVKAGFDLNFVHEQIANLFGGDGSFSYSNANNEFNFINFAQDALGANATRTQVGTGSSAVFTNASTRHYNSFSQTVDQLTGVGADDFWNQNIDGFLEDAWKAKPSLLLSIGVRYDVQLVPGPDMPFPQATSPVAYNATSQINPDFKMVQPRIGFAWNPLPGTVVRGGYGIFFGQVSNSAYYTLRRENGVYQKQYGPVSAIGAPTPYVTAGTVTAGPNTTGVACVPVAPATVCYNNSASYAAYAPQGGVPIYTPPGPAPVNPVTGAPITPTGLAAVPTATLTIRGMDPSFRNPQSHSADLAVEQALPYHASLTLSYVGNRALRLPVYVDTNIDPNSVVTNRTYTYTPTGGTPRTFSVPVYTNRLNTTVGAVATGFSDVNSWYHSFVASFRKPMSHGVEVLANYTWAHAMDGGQTYGGNGTFNGTDAPLIPFALGHRQGRAAEYARSDLDIRGRFVGTIVAKSALPISNKYAKYAANGWLLSATVTAQTGEPITGYTSGTITSLSGGALGNLTSDSGVTNALFTSGPGARVPDAIAGRNGFKGPGVHNTDARVSRSFPIVSDRYHFEVAAELFNVANHRNILSVNTALASYVAPGSGACPTAAANPLGLGCFTQATAFATPSTTTNTIYGARQLQLIGKFIF
ncbi:Carboxypeptidase regulatory-like domain-containing protein [Granulicella rosea]|uniref:Carboxypeptidase regulatory-like domain-containing protein n=1 Tax=Granulicella rosea TaxID=474952 RepID=A0A239LB64_9BACT|nr:TonB-dependent receptor [Granulicella rosea]SNT27721.1 Carboxypeptidase regulatory-like domain-containing protein [Granulicella rosea]